MTEKFTVIVEQGEDGYLISDVVELPGCHTQAKTYDELLKRTKEVIALYLKTVKDIVLTYTKRIDWKDWIPLVGIANLAGSIKDAEDTGSVERLKRF